uniref:Uncharacterized protein n=1 Tax=Arundo donax TaxID=35708 RepID=A0A0A9GSR7_ARUDO
MAGSARSCFRATMCGLDPPPPLQWSYCRTRRRMPQASRFHAGAMRSPLPDWFHPLLCRINTPQQPWPLCACQRCKVCLAQASSSRDA